MKGKITIVLLGLALVFGMIAASCDNDAFPSPDAKDQSTLMFYMPDSDGVPLFYKEVDRTKYIPDANNNPPLDADGKIVKRKKKTIVPATTADAKQVPPITGQLAWDILYGEKTTQMDQLGGEVKVAGKTVSVDLRGKLNDGSWVQKYILSKTVPKPNNEPSATLQGAPIIIENPVWVSSASHSSPGNSIIALYKDPIDDNPNAVTIPTDPTLPVPPPGNAPTP